MVSLPFICCIKITSVVPPSRLVLQLLARGEGEGEGRIFAKNGTG